MIAIAQNYIFQPKLCLFLLGFCLAIRGSAQSTEPYLKLSPEQNNDLKENLINKNWFFYNSKALEFKNTNIIIDIETLKNNQKKQTIDSLSLVNCSITIKSSKHDALDDKKLKEERQKPPKLWLFRISASYLNIKNCIFKNDSNQMVGFLDNDNTENVFIEDNKIEKFHGAIYCEAKKKENPASLPNERNTTCTIKNNLLHKNSFGNLVIHGFENTLICNNKVYFAGNGSSGDGFNLSACSKAIVHDNTFLGGSCYGGAVNLMNISELQIKNNIWINTLTSCLRFTEPQTMETPMPKVIINISNNYFIDNAAYGILIENYSKTQIFFEISQNVFHKTMPVWGLSDCDKIKMQKENIFSVGQIPTEEYLQKNISERLPYQKFED